MNKTIHINEGTTSEITSSTATAIHATSDAFFPLFNALIPCKHALFIVSRYRGRRACDCRPAPRGKTNPQFYSSSIFIRPTNVYCNKSCMTTFDFIYMLGNGSGGHFF